MNILISNYTGIGNFILKLPMVFSLLNNNQNSKIYFIGKKTYFIHQILKINPKIEFIFLENIWQILKFFLLKRNLFDEIYLPFDSSPNFLLFLLIFFKKKNLRIHYLAKNEKKNIKYHLKTIFLRIFYKNSNLINLRKNCHEIDLNYDLINHLHINKTYTSLNEISHNIKTKKIQLNMENYIVIQPFSGNGILSPKIWPYNYYFELIENILINNKLNKYKIVLVGDQNEVSENQFLFKNTKVINLIGKTSLNELFYIIKSSKIVISNDSSIMHIASLYNKDTIAIYGPTDFNRTKPLHENVKFAFSKHESFGSMNEFKMTELEVQKKWGKNCLIDVKPEVILKMILEFAI